MTFSDLAWKNAWRKPFRTFLLMVCVAVAFLIYGLTASFVNGSQGAAGASDQILGVMSAAGRTQPLPVSYKKRIAADPDVAATGLMTRLRGFVTVEKNIVAISAVDHENLMAVSGRELGLTPDLMAALDQGRSNVLVGRALAKAQGWAAGERITVTSFDIARQDGSHDWQFQIAGIFDGESAATDTYFVIARYDYVNAARARGKDTVSAFVLRPMPGVNSGELATRIDKLFANSAAPTRTQSEKQFLEAFLRQYADISLIVNLVVGAAFVTLLMIIVNTMIFAMRERRFEIGVLKTLGFSGPRIVALILAEVVFILAAGGATGLGLAKLATGLAGPAAGLTFSGVIVAKACVMIVVIALLTGVIPAFNALRTPIISAFRKG